MYSTFRRLKILFSGKLVFEDGSIVRYVNREGYEYSEGEKHVMIWVDFQEGFFSNGKVMKADSITTWLNFSDEACVEIDSDKKNQIIRKLSDYLNAIWRDVIVG